MLTSPACLASLVLVPTGTEDTAAECSDTPRALRNRSVETNWLVMLSVFLDEYGLSSCFVITDLLQALYCSSWSLGCHYY